jgi:hypothetical protein
VRSGCTRTRPARSTAAAVVWFVRLVTDPITDVIAYSARYLQRLEARSSIQTAHTARTESPGARRRTIAVRVRVIQMLSKRHPGAQATRTVEMD